MNKFVLFEELYPHAEIAKLKLPPIFPVVGIDPMNFDALEVFAESELYPHAEMFVTVYVTGLTQAVVAVINACRRLNIVLTLMHYNRDTDSYEAQVVEI